MQIFELKDPKILGEEHPTYGFTFWSETDGDYPVMFNSKQGNIMPGTRIMAEESEVKVSKNNKEYLRLKKVKLEDNPTSKEEQKPFTKKPEPTFKRATAEQQTKDTQITRNMVWKNLLSLYDIPSMTPDSEQWNEFWDNVELHTEMLVHGNYDSLVPETESTLKHKMANSSWANQSKEQVGSDDEDLKNLTTTGDV